MLVIEDLHVEIDGTKILNGLTLSIKQGETHAIMGPNGSGKSTLAKVIAGHPDYKVTQGSILYQGAKKQIDLIQIEPEMRAREGIFLAYQYPIEIPGVNTAEFLRAAYNASRKHQSLEEVDPFDFEGLLKEKMGSLKMTDKFVNRSVNVDFSGGEKKRNEILQMAILDPRLAVLDETDSGLDVDSMRIVANGVNKLKRSDNAFLLITHYQRLLDYIIPDFVHILHDGKIVKSSTKELALEVEEKGYDWIK